MAEGSRIADEMRNAVGRLAQRQSLHRLRYLSQAPQDPEHSESLKGKEVLWHTHRCPADGIR